MAYLPKDVWASLGGIQRPEVQFLMGRTQNFFFVPHTRHEEKNLFLCKWLIICPSHTLEIFQMKNSFGSSPVESTTSNSGPKSQNAQLNTPCTPALINWKEMAVLLTVVYFYSQTNQVLYKVCNWLQCWQEKRNFKQNYFHWNCISFIHFKCSWNDAMQHHII